MATKMILIPLIEYESLKTRSIPSVSQASSAPSQDDAILKSNLPDELKIKLFQGAKRIMLNEVNDIKNAPLLIKNVNEDQQNATPPTLKTTNSSTISITNESQTPLSNTPSSLSVSGNDEAGGEVESFLKANDVQPDSDGNTIINGNKIDGTRFAKVVNQLSDGRRKRSPGTYIVMQYLKDRDWPRNIFTAGIIRAIDSIRSKSTDVTNDYPRKELVLKSKWMEGNTSNGNKKHDNGIRSAVKRPRDEDDNDDDYTGEDVSTRLKRRRCDTSRKRSHDTDQHYPEKKLRMENVSSRKRKHDEDAQISVKKMRMENDSSRKRKHEEDTQISVKKMRMEMMNPKKRKYMDEVLHGGKRRRDETVSSVKRKLEGLDLPCKRKFENGCCPVSKRQKTMITAVGLSSKRKNEDESIQPFKKVRWETY